MQTLHIGVRYFLKILNVLASEFCQFAYREVNVFESLMVGVVELIQMTSVAYCRQRLVVSVKLGIACERG